MYIVYNALPGLASGASVGARIGASVVGASVAGVRVSVQHNTINTLAHANSQICWSVSTDMDLFIHACTCTSHHIYKSRTLASLYVPRCVVLVHYETWREYGHALLCRKWTGMHDRIYETWREYGYMT